MAEATWWAKEEKGAVLWDGEQGSSKWLKTKLELLRIQVLLLAMKDGRMPVRPGRIEKRIQLAVPLQISSMLDPASSERTTSENVCSLGMRVLTQRARELNERLLIRSLMGDLRTFARVVYCKRLPDGHFALGLQFQGVSLKWSRDSAASAAD